MKTYLLKSLVLVWVSFLLTSCSTDQDDNLSSWDAEIDQVEIYLTNGSWQITKFVDSDMDETDNFNGYNFEFQEGGKLIASNGVNTYEGSWGVVHASSSSGENSSSLDLIINFNLSNDFEDLSDDWDITSVTDTRIEMTDVSGGNGGTDSLTFERI